MNELFQIEPIKSPRLRWMERHHLTVYQNIEMAVDARFTAYHGMAVIGHGATYDDALFAAAKSLNIKLWNEENA